MVKRNNSVRLTKNAIPTEMLGLKVNPSGSLAAMKHVILAEPKSNNLTRGTSNNRCRACLEDNSSVLQSLFDYLEEEIIADVLSFCTGVEVS